MKQKRSVLYIGGVFILILVAVGFFITPLTEIFGANSRASITFGKYGNRSITYIPGNYFSQQVEIAAGALSQPGQPIDNFTTRLIWREGFDNAIIHEAIMEEMERSNADIAEGVLDMRIVQHPRFQGENGFDIDAYRALNAQERARFRELERETALREIYISDITEQALLSDGEQDLFRSIGLEERQIAFTVVTDQQIDDAEIMQYVDNNADLFERLRVAVIEIEDHRRNARQIRQQILDDGSNFYDKQSELNTNEGVEITTENEWLFFAELLERYPDAEADLEQLKNIPLNTPSQLIPYGNDQYVIFMVVEREQANDIEDRSELFSYARNYIDVNDTEYHTQRLLSAIEMRRALVESNSTMSLVSAGAENGFEVEVSDFFPLNYGNLDLYPAVSGDENGYLDGIDRNQEFLREVFSLDIGELSTAIMHRNNFILLQVEDIRVVDAEEYDSFGDFYQNQISVDVEEGLETVLVQRGRLFDNFDAIYEELIAIYDDEETPEEDVPADDELPLQ